MNQQAPKISVVIPAKNEADRLKQCLSCLLGFANEVIVVDDGSDDETFDLAEALGARVIPANRTDQPIDWLNTVGFEAATGEWILRIDADEHLTPSLAKELKRIAREDNYDGVRFARKNMMFGGWAKYGGWFKNDQLRFFRKSSWDRSWDCAIHSQVAVNGRIVDLPGTEAYSTIHHDYQSIRQFVRRSLLNYAYLESSERFEAGQRFSIFRTLIRPLRMFIGRYLVRQGFRDGRRGLVLALLLGAYAMCVEFYLWDKARGVGSCA